MPDKSSHKDPHKRIRQLEEEILSLEKRNKELRESEIVYRNLFEDSDIFISLYDKNGVCLKMNKNVAINFFGKAYDFVGKSFHNIHPDNADAYTRRVSEAIETNTVRKYEDIVRFPKGDRWLLSTVYPVAGQNGAPYAAQILSVDITERKQTEFALEKSEALFRGLFDNMPSGSAIYKVLNKGLRGSDYIIKAFNNTSLEIEGKRLEEVLDKSLFDLRPNIDDYGLIPILKKVWDTGEPAFFPVKIYQDENFSNYYENYVFKTPSGEVVTIYNDVTDQKLAEIELKESQERFELAMQFANDGLFDWNLETNKIYYSPGWKRLLGYDDDEIKNEFSEWERLTLAEDIKDSWKILSELLEGKRERFEKEFKMLHKDGHWVDILSRANVTYNEEGKASRVIGTHVDITGRKQAEEEIIRQKQKAEQYLNIAGVMLIGLDAHGRVSIANKKACDILECDDEKEIIGKNWFDNFIPRYLLDDVHSVFGQLLAGKIELAEYYENPVISKSGTEKIIAWHNTVMNDADGNIFGILSSGEDISVKRQLEAQVLRSQKMDAIATLAGGIAHDFNNMIGIITGNVSYALSKLNKSDELSEVLSDIREGAKQAENLTQQLLTFAKGGEPVKKTADLNPLLREFAQFLTRGAKIRCEFELADDLWPAEVDSGQLNQAVSNLVINARQAMPDGGIIHIGTKNELLTDDNNVYRLKPGQYIRITIRDQGSGISENHLSKIFDPFFTTKEKGSGLGLATSYSIIRRHGGHLSVESEAGRGSTFHICLPASEKSILHQKKDMGSEHQGKGHILIMDDQEAILRMVGRMLNRIGYEVAFATDGSQAIEMYRKAFQSRNPFDLVILDLTIPGGMDGSRTMPELLKIDPEVKAIVSSGYSNDPVMANYQDYGFCGVAPKPYSMRHISELLNALLGDKD